MPHLLRVGAVRFAAEISTFLTERGHSVCTMSECMELLCKEGAAAELFDGEADMAAVIGGDGTVLRSIRTLLAYEIPIWAVNFGHVGYLTDCEPSEAFDALRMILEKEYITERRIMLSGVIADRPDVSRESFTALNEAVIHRSAMSRALKMELSVSGSDIQTIPADGVIVATPTGSTAYNLSAGGPILMPESGNLVVTPVCSHMLGGSPIVVSGRDTVGVKISLPAPNDDGSDALPMIVIDGCEKYVLHDGASVTIRRAKKHLKLVRTRSDSFYRTLQKKLAQNI